MSNRQIGSQILECKSLVGVMDGEYTAHLIMDANSCAWKITSGNHCIDHKQGMSPDGAVSSLKNKMRDLVGDRMSKLRAEQSVLSARIANTAKALGKPGEAETTE